MYECDKCGTCCRNLNKSTIYKDLDRGDGTCKYLEGNLCSIYFNRPKFCRIDECYYDFFQSDISLEEYYRLNHESCNNLKKQ